VPVCPGAAHPGLRRHRCAPSTLMSVGCAAPAMTGQQSVALT
jgi:hypothetical protein